MLVSRIVFYFLCWDHSRARLRCKNVSLLLQGLQLRLWCRRRRGFVEFLFQNATKDYIIHSGVPYDNKIWTANAIQDAKFHEIVVEAHMAFINAGSSFITTHNFGVTPGNYLVNPYPPDNLSLEPPTHQPWYTVTRCRIHRLRNWEVDCRGRQAGTGRSRWNERCRACDGVGITASPVRIVSAWQGDQ